MYLRYPVIPAIGDTVQHHSSTNFMNFISLNILFQKITGKELQYEALIGKPCEITYRYAEKVIADVAKRIGIHRPMRKLYFIGYVLLNVIFKYCVLILIHHFNLYIDLVNDITDLPCSSKFESFCLHELSRCVQYLSSRSSNNTNIYFFQRQPKC